MEKSEGVEGQKTLPVAPEGMGLSKATGRMKGEAVGTSHDVSVILGCSTCPIEQAKRGERLPPLQHLSTKSTAVSELILQHSKTTNKHTPPVRSPPPLPEAKPCSRCFFGKIFLSERLSQANSPIIARTDERMACFAAQTVLFPQEADPRPLQSSSKVQGTKGSLNWGNGQDKKDRFHEVDTIDVGCGETVIEELAGVSSQDLARKMLARNREAAASLGLAEPIEFFLKREQDWVHTLAFRQAAEVQDVSKIAVIETTNHQVHRIIGTGRSELCFEQFGGLSDNRNSYVSLKLLGEIVRDRSKAKEILEVLQKKLRASHSEKERAVIQRAIEEVLSPEEALKQRRFLLEQQMLIVVYNRLQTAAESKTVKDGALHLSHLSLLNPNLKKTEMASGLWHDESSMIDDMEVLFQEFDGAKILFDSADAPYTADGIIHMPRGAASQQLTLYTHYGNISPQGARSRSGNQQEDACNSRMISEMRESLKSQRQEANSPRRIFELAVAEQLLVSCIGDLNAHRQSFQLAANLLVIQIILGWQVSTGCYSNKDRGGVVGSLVCTTYLAFKKKSGLYDGRFCSRTAEVFVSRAVASASSIATFREW